MYKCVDIGSEGDIVPFEIVCNGEDKRKCLKAWLAELHVTSESFGCCNWPCLVLSKQTCVTPACATWTNSPSDMTACPMCRIFLPSRTTGIWNKAKDVYVVSSVCKNTGTKVIHSVKNII